MCDNQTVPSELCRENPCIFDICCFCIPVKIGCFILAYFQLISFIFTGIVSVIGIFTGWVLMVSRSSLEDQNSGLYVLILNVVLIIVIVISLPFTIVLIVGLHKEKRKYIKIYLIYAGLCLIVFSVFLLMVFITTQADLMGMILPVFSIGINIYFLLVFRSHSLKLKFEKTTAI